MITQNHTNHVIAQHLHPDQQVVLCVTAEAPHGARSPAINLFRLQTNQFTYLHFAGAA